MKYIFSLFTFFLFLSPAVSQGQTPINQTTTVILVRHAEKAKDGTTDPPLTRQGTARAVELAYLFRDDTISGVFSTNYQRTVQTAKFTADYHGVSVKGYLPEHQNFFLENIINQYRGKKVLVVGHSNTIPQMLNFLTGTDRYQNIKDYVYHDLFIVQVGTVGKAKVLHLNFGSASLPPPLINVNANNIAIQGYDVVSYFERNKPMKGSLDYVSEYKGVLFQFANAQHLDLFEKNPKKYLPEFGGWCAYFMGLDGSEEGKSPKKQDVDPTSFLLSKGKLYLFSKSDDLDGKKQWEEEEKEVSKRANEFWEELKKE